VQWSFLTSHLTVAAGSETWQLVWQGEEVPALEDVSLTTLEVQIIAGDLSMEQEYFAGPAASHELSHSHTSGHVSETNADVSNAEDKVVEALVLNVTMLVWHACQREPWLVVSLCNMVKDISHILVAEDQPLGG